MGSWLRESQVFTSIKTKRWRGKIIAASICTNCAIIYLSFLIFWIIMNAIIWWSHNNHLTWIISFYTWIVIIICWTNQSLELFMLFPYHIHFFLFRLWTEFHQILTPWSLVNQLLLRGMFSLLTSTDHFRLIDVSLIGIKLILTVNSWHSLVNWYHSRS